MAIVLVTAAVVGGAPAVAEVIADFARNSDKVDGRHAVGADSSVRGRKGKLVATSGTTGRLPNNIITKAPNADELDGKSLGEVTPLVRGDVDASPALSTGPLALDKKKVNSLHIRVPSRGLLVVTGMCEVTVEFSTPNQAFTLGPLIDGNNVRGVGSGPMNRAQAQVIFTADTPNTDALLFTVVARVGRGRHSVAQVLEHTTGTDSYYYTRNNLTVEFIPQGSVTYTDS